MLSPLPHKLKAPSQRCGLFSRAYSLYTRKNDIILLLQQLHESILSDVSSLLQRAWERQHQELSSQLGKVCALRIIDSLTYFNVSGPHAGIRGDPVQWRYAPVSLGASTDIV